ncbi:MAG: nitronate monooxygenase [Deltaproteobacteria bacterium]|nr:MAG: nitronate monooxygenase [Deltaproteobacteria bacterium]HHE74137.1 nitronate monooxygenase [Desulfobacteraceae bacterium]
MTYPLIIQGGMGAGVSNWQLAQAVSQTGQLGVISGTALDAIFSRRLQLGDPGGHMQRAMSHFPDTGMVDRILARYYRPADSSGPRPFKTPPMILLHATQQTKELTVVANFVEVFLAKEGHANPVGTNLLEKVQLPNLYALYGAMLAGVDYVIMGAGIPREIPGVLDLLADHQSVSLKIAVGAANGNRFHATFDPKTFFKKALPPLKRPKFLSIVSSVLLATMMARKANGRIDGFVVELPEAGGHNAPPRGKLLLSDRGEPVYGDRDAIELEKIKALGLPFWMAGCWGTPEKLQEAISLGAKGIQIGTVLAFSKESGFTDAVKNLAIENIQKGTASVFTDPSASPTGFPFKVLSLEGSLSEINAYQERPRKCDLGYLRHLYEKPDGKIGYRCPAEPEAVFIGKGGNPDDMKGKKCLCNALLSNVGVGQMRKSGYVENTLVTSGDGIMTICRFLKDRASYKTEDVINWLLEGVA